MLKLLFFAGLLSFDLQAQSRQEILEALKASQDKPEIKTQIKPASEVKVGKSESLEINSNCSTSKQNSLPLLDLMLLLTNEGGKLDIAYDPESAELTVDGGGMISNCNSMLSFDITNPTKDHPYLFMVNIKDCGAKECSYKVVTKDEKGNNISSPEPVKFTPDLNGFYDCLKHAKVVSDDGSIDKKQRVISPLYAKKKGVNVSSEVWFASHGPMGADQNGEGVYSKNKKPGFGCYFFEDVKKDGYAFYNKADIEKNKKELAFQDICASGDYKLISKKLADYKEMSALYSVLLKVRDQALEDEIKKLAGKLKTETDFSALDVSVIDDFEKMIINPKKKKIEEVYGMMLAAPAGKEKDAYKKQLEELQKELVAYSKAPFLTAKDLERMHDVFNKNRSVPFNDPTYYGAVLTLNRIRTTIDEYKSFNSVVATGQKDSPLHAERNILARQKVFATEMSDKRDRFERMNNLAPSKTPGLLKDKKSIIASIENNAQYLNQLYEDHMQEIQRCYKPHLAYKRDKCIMEETQFYQSEVARVTEVNKAAVQALKDLESDIQDSRSIDVVASKNKVADSYDETDDDEVDGSKQVYNFNYNPSTSRPNNNTQQNIFPNYNPYALLGQQQQQQMPMWPQQQQQYNPYGMNQYNMMGQHGMNFNLGMGMNRNPAAAGMYNPYMQHQQMPMWQQPHHNPMAGGQGGMYNFSF
jgi:hypothetical protein